MFCSKGWVGGTNACAAASFRFDSFQSLAASSWAVQAMAIPRVPYQPPPPPLVPDQSERSSRQRRREAPCPSSARWCHPRPARYGIADPTHSCRSEEPHRLRALPHPPTLVKTSTVMAGAVPQLLGAVQGKVDQFLESRRLLFCPALVIRGLCLWGNTATRTRASK